MLGTHIHKSSAHMIKECFCWMARSSADLPGSPKANVHTSLQPKVSSNGHHMMKPMYSSWQQQNNSVGKGATPIMAS